MKELKTYACCFIGHRKIEKTPKLTKRLLKEIEVLITEKKVDSFYFGSKSEFNDLCYKTVTDLKEKYPHIKRILARTFYPDIDDYTKKFFLDDYEDTYFPERAINAGKVSYIARNKDMIDRSSFCIVYYDENYLPPERKNSKRDLTSYQPKSGTRISYDYALKNKKMIINLFE